MRSKHSWKGRLLVSSCMATSATVLLVAAAPAAAGSVGSCLNTTGTTCWLWSFGTPGTQPTSAGQSGGGGQRAAGWDIILSGGNFVDIPSSLISPINLTSTGGTGAGGKDGNLDIGHYDAGKGGNGGDAGNISLVTEAGTTGSTHRIPPGGTLSSTGRAGGGAGVGYT